MDFLVGMSGFLTALAVFMAGVWVGKTAAKPMRTARTVLPGEMSLSDEQRQREFYNFLHYDGSRMPSATDTER